jgi:cyclopropane fatty-acyl-phospholipid synthase-like methyltransferase
MDRKTWLRERREAVVQEYDAMAAEDHEYPNNAQREWVRRLLATCVPGDVVLDAPCGTGRYFSLVAEAGLNVIGIDQSAGVLEHARRRGVAVQLERVSLQELSFSDEFDAVMTIDAMEHMPPEDWPLVLTNLRRAVRPGGYLYFTVEERTDPAVLAKAFSSLTEDGLPAVAGEVAGSGVAGYHYYPSRKQVLTWLDETGWRVVDEGFTPENGWGYRHLLVQRNMEAEASTRFS